MRVSDFDYHLPKELIAAYPLKERDQARLLVVDRSNGTIAHRVFTDLAGYLCSGDAVVLNDTKVRPCRLFGVRATGGKVELLLVKQGEGLTFEALIKPGRLRLNETIRFPQSDISCTITGRSQVRFTATDVAQVYALGTLPLPPYIKRRVEELDSEYYQTVYARHDGSIAAPTAGLHFTTRMLEAMDRQGVGVSSVTLHVGCATFRPVKSESVESHAMEKEDFFVPSETARLLKGTVHNGGRIVAVGTTSCRTLETYAATGLTEGATGLFIYPGYTFKLVSGLLTNFHLPKTTLFMLVCAFAGTELAKAAYASAIENKYRFYSYGDAMLIL